MAAASKSGAAARPGRVIFVTGTDTGVGKTVLSALLLQHLRQAGRPALALKPFCSGSRADAELLQALQGSDLSLDEINPWFFPEPLAPQAAARLHRRVLQPASAVRLVRQAIARCRSLASPPAAEPCVIVEGAGGLLVPIARGFTMLDWITRLAAAVNPPGSALARRLEVLVVAGNRLGVINHTLLTMRALAQARRARGARFRVQVTLMNLKSTDDSARFNPHLLREWLAPVRVHQLPYLGLNCDNAAAVRRHERRLRGELAKILRS